MHGMTDTEFLDELPDRTPRLPGKLRLALEANPGKWTKYDGSPKSVYNLANQMSNDGAQFEGAIRRGVGYIRCVKP